MSDSREQFEEWLSWFMEETDGEWRYADREALLFAAFEAGLSASRAVPIVLPKHEFNGKYFGGIEAMDKCKAALIAQGYTVAN
jgi:hypothetical protein